MQMEDRVEEGVLVVKPLEQALDAYAASPFRERMAEFVAQGSRQIVLDLSHVNFLDSTGLGAIVSSLKRLEGNGVMVICNAGEMVTDVFRLTRMDRVFPITATVEEAITVAKERMKKAA
ncbi:MAG: STAS domain-containing protein [Candidatus Eisenbacteria bacterium]|jgi:anti-sigma B factor antagonist|nr:STAS domain-containing protein [Candidatus Eisenbacteria bacterium]